MRERFPPLSRLSAPPQGQLQRGWEPDPPLPLCPCPAGWSYHLASRSCTPTLRIIRSAQKPAKRLGFYHLILQHGSRQCPRPLPQGQVFVGLKGSPYSLPPCTPSPTPLVRSHASGPQSAPCGA